MQAFRQNKGASRLDDKPLPWDGGPGSLQWPAYLAHLSQSLFKLLAKARTEPFIMALPELAHAHYRGPHRKIGLSGALTSQNG
jgi:hypothetical protein